MEYTITTKRLGLRNWKEKDVGPFAEMSIDPLVMRYFPSSLSLQECKQFVENMQSHFEQYGYTYFAVDLLESDEFIGFIGLKNQTFESFFTPCVDIGWRLKTKFWGQGLASEGAQACLQFAKKKLVDEQEILAIVPANNRGSRRVAEKIGMHFKSTFKHPRLRDYPEIKTCALYSIANN